jgi:hypothetical protein
MGRTTLIPIWGDATLSKISRKAREAVGVLVLAVAGMLAARVAWAAVPTVVPLDGFEVVDAEDRVVGVAYPAGTLPTWSSNEERFDINIAVVPFEVGDILVLLQFYYQRLTGTAPPVFASRNCLGPPLILPRYNPGTTFVAPPGHTVYIPDTTVPLLVRPMESMLLPDGQCDGSISHPSVSVHPAVPLVNLDRLFTPPFRLRGRPLVTREPR